MVSKYVVSGSTAALVQLGVLVFLVERLDFSHMPAVALAFIISAFVAFSFQKFWTFRDRSLDRGHFQIVSYLTLAAIAFFLTVFLMYLFVEVLEFWYVPSQIVTIGLVTIVTFLTNKNVIFNRRSVIFRQKEPKQDSQ